MTGRWRFDPACVAVGTALLALTGLGGAMVATVSMSRAERVITPVVQVCADGGPAADALAARGACAAADDAARVGPYGAAP